MQVSVRDNNVEQALRALKKKLQREGVFREMKLKQHFEKPSVKKAREQAEAVGMIAHDLGAVFVDLPAELAALDRSRLGPQRHRHEAAENEEIMARLRRWFS